jgi:hypothetical protein
MNDPHVEKLFYKVIVSDDTDYDKAPPISGETQDFKWQLSKDQLAVEMKIPCATESEAKEVVDEYLKGWRVTTGLLHRPGNLSFKFSSSILVNRPLNNGGYRTESFGSDSSEIILLSDEIKEHTSYESFAAPPEKFKVSPEVEMMFFRYRLYREGRETLRSMAYWCLKVMEFSAGGRHEASEQYGVDFRVLRKLMELCWTKGDVDHARQMKSNTGITLLKTAEREWIRAVVKRLILRVGEYAYDPGAKLQLLIMADFPSIQ